MMKLHELISSYIETDSAFDVKPLRGLLNVIHNNLNVTHRDLQYNMTMSSLFTLLMTTLESKSFWHVVFKDDVDGPEAKLLLQILEEARKLYRI